MKALVGFILFMVLVCGGSALFVTWAFNSSERAAKKACAQVGATPRYTYQTRYICVTPDGRVVG